MFDASRLHRPLPRNPCRHVIHTPACRRARVRLEKRRVPAARFSGRSIQSGLINFYKSHEFTLHLMVEMHAPNPMLVGGTPKTWKTAKISRAIVTSIVLSNIEFGQQRIAVNQCAEPRGNPCLSERLAFHQG